MAYERKMGEKTPKRNAKYLYFGIRFFNAILYK